MTHVPTVIHDITKIKNKNVENKASRAVVAHAYNLSPQKAEAGVSSRKARTGQPELLDREPLPLKPK